MGFLLVVLVFLLAEVAAAPMKARKSRAWGGIKPGASWANYAWGNVDKDAGEADWVDVVFVDKDRNMRNTDKLDPPSATSVCYMSAGTVEDWRDDAQKLSEYISESSVYKGEAWLDITRWAEFKNLMSQRMDRMKQQKCDAVEVDNIDCYVHKCVDGVSEQSLKQYQIDYIRWLVDAAHSRGLQAGMKNAVSLVPYVGHFFDFAINESCTKFDECNYYQSFKSARKAIFAVEYSASGTEACDQAWKYGMSMKYKQGDKFLNC